METQRVYAEIEKRRIEKINAEAEEARVKLL